MKEIQLSQGLVALVDDDDFDRVSEFKWCAARDKRSGRVCCAKRLHRMPDGTRRTVGLHNFIVGVQSRTFLVDHINGDVLDNRKCNLRVCSHSENMRNSVKKKAKSASSQFKGVFKQGDKWVIQLWAGSKRQFSARCGDEVLAAKIYNTVAEHFHGEFARINELDSVQKVICGE